MSGNEPSLEEIGRLFKVADMLGARQSEVSPDNRVGKTVDECRQFGRQTLADGDVAASVRHFRRAIELSTVEDPSLRTELAAALDAAGDETGAARNLFRAAKDKGTASEALAGLADIYKRSGKYSDAVSQLQEAIDADPESALLRKKLSELWELQRQPERALEEARAAAELAPKSSFFQYWYADKLVERKRFAEALEQFRLAIELSPGDEFLYQEAAIAFWCLDKREEARKAIEFAIHLAPDKAFLEEVKLRMQAIMDGSVRTVGADLDTYDRDLCDRFFAKIHRLTGNLS